MFDCFDLAADSERSFFVRLYRFSDDRRRQTNLLSFCQFNCRKCTQLCVSYLENSATELYISVLYCSRAIILTVSDERIAVSEACMYYNRL